MKDIKLNAAVDPAVYVLSPIVRRYLYHHHFKQVKAQRLLHDVKSTDWAAWQRALAALARFTRERNKELSLFNRQSGRIKLRA